MRKSLLISCLLLFAATGCSKFRGEWIEQGTIAADGTLQRTESDRRMALKFNPPATVRYGSYYVGSGVVDHQTVQEDTYFVMQRRSVAQTGTLTLRPQGKNHLLAYIADGQPKRFVRNRGRTIFPPMAILPSLAKAPSMSPESQWPDVAATASDERALTLEISEGG